MICKGIGVFSKQNIALFIFGKKIYTQKQSYVAQTMAQTDFCSYEVTDLTQVISNVFSVLFQHYTLHLNLQ